MPCLERIANDIHSDQLEQVRKKRPTLKLLKCIISYLQVALLFQSPDVYPMLGNFTALRTKGEGQVELLLLRSEQNSLGPIILYLGRTERSSAIEGSENLGGLNSKRLFILVLQISWGWPDFQSKKFRVWNQEVQLTQGLLNRWTSQLDLGCTTGGLERVVSVHNST